MKKLILVVVLILSAAMIFAGGQKETSQGSKPVEEDPADVETKEIEIAHMFACRG